MFFPGVKAIGTMPETCSDTHHNEIRNRSELLIVYTDGSGVNGQIGAAAVCPALTQTRKADHCICVIYEL